MDPNFTVGIPQLRKNHPFLFDSSIGDDFFIIVEDREAPDQSQSIFDIFHDPLRFDGLLMFYCSRGTFDIDINLRTYTVQPKQLVINIPGNIFRISNPSTQESSPVRMICVGLSRSFLSSIRIDFSNSYEEGMKVLAQPCVSLSPVQTELARDYYRLTHHLLSSPIHDKKGGLAGLISSIASVIRDEWQLRQENTPSVRSHAIFERFVALVSAHHTKERGLAFYAEKLCLTPKYLSKLIKQTSGRSAPQWIDGFVILEAKNMLRYSEIPIKEIVYRLNFPNQSVFYKYFKMHTGMTPSAYRKS